MMRVQIMAQEENILPMEAVTFVHLTSNRSNRGLNITFSLFPNTDSMINNESGSIIAPPSGGEAMGGHELILPRPRGRS